MLTVGIVIGQLDFSKLFTVLGAVPADGTNTLAELKNRDLHY
jgi:hypothetical protein